MYKTNFISKRPDFDELYQLRKAAEETIGLINSLAQEDDIPQRATDLLNHSKDFLKLVNLSVIEEEDSD